MLHALGEFRSASIFHRIDPWSSGHRMLDGCHDFAPNLKRCWIRAPAPKDSLTSNLSWPISLQPPRSEEGRSLGVRSVVRLEVMSGVRLGKVR